MIEAEQKARRILSDMDEESYSFKKFKELFKGKTEGGTTTDYKELLTLKYWYQKKIKILRELDRINTADSYRDSLTSLTRFFGKEDFTFQDCSVDNLKKYQKWMLDQSMKINTVKIYLENLRAIFNDAIASKNAPIKRSDYPFGRRKFKIPSSKNVKRPLSKEQIWSFFTYEPEEGSWEQLARDMFLFSYLGEGVNMADILRFKYNQLRGTNIVYHRRKTINSVEEIREIVITLDQTMLDIIERWGSKPAHSDHYIFPTLNSASSEEERVKKIKQFTKQVNKYLKVIAGKIGIDKQVTTYYARHTFADVLRKSGVSTEMIQEMLGHTNIKTTENYLSSFEDDVKSELKRKFLLPD